MPASIPSQQTPGKDSSGWVQSRSSNPPRDDDSGSGVEAPSSRRRLHKPVSEANLQSEASHQPSKSITGSRFGAMAKRRLSIRDQKAPQGPRPQESSQRR
ncbi:uncharacterized protein ASPGLDRAFT_37196 [Aspergillus glaucus CBS 516.65]|uniref:Uncharacterized protein n=1 Tax=Aspergillus glaucus CBS 516.65 TaxID=1160497 RepID=A0A1L9VEZ0_ASPGL|nr:hypothetical protein ASPGLDRAFT_37196 [Aspergillus glaucus CBS 516.65]OJJ82455.1 hypothetical protein ASPGLDRAFT_37196 [Aspergillus glaucus CBS 516.65]